MADIASQFGFIFAYVGTIAMMSFLLIKDNHIYHFFEYTYLGCTAGLGIVLLVKQIILQGVTPLTEGNYIWIIPIILGLSMYLRFVKMGVWIGRYALAIVVGVGLGLSMRGALLANIYGQARATMQALFVADPIISLGRTLMAIGAVLMLLYFLMTREHTGTYGRVMTWARYGLMITLGCTFGNQIMARFALLSGRFLWLLTQAGLIAGV
jgi:hypothetical protein